MKGLYSDQYSDFACLILACSIDGERYLIEDTECEVGQTGWCSCHLVDDNY